MAVPEAVQVAITMAVFVRPPRLTQLSVLNNFSANFPCDSLFSVSPDAVLSFHLAHSLPIFAIVFLLVRTRILLNLGSVAT